MSEKLIIDLSKLDEPDYIGSVQRLYYLKDNKDLMVCETTAGGSVFDVGTIFSIKNSDRCRAALRHRIFTMLGSSNEWKNIHRIILKKYKQNKAFCEFLSKGLLEEFKSKGAPTHHMGMINEKTGEVHKTSFTKPVSKYILVKKYQIIKPSRIVHFTKSLWDYNEYHISDKFVIPLENVVRFGVTPGSSIYTKCMNMNDLEKKEYLEELGLQGNMLPWQRFPLPIVDFATKYEPKDRNLSLQEALYVSGCKGETFLNTVKMSLLGSFLVADFFDKLGLFLWDVKWEIAKDGHNLVFVDTIDTDSIRVTAKIQHKNHDYQIHFNKQAMRDYYKIIYPEWYLAVNSAKSLGDKTGKSFHEHLKVGQARADYPKTPEVDGEFSDIQKSKLEAPLMYIIGESTAADTKEKLKMIGKREIIYYEKTCAFDKFCKFNRINE